MKDNWTLDDMPDQAGKVVVITGATSGLGYAMAREFAALNATLVMAVRNEKLGAERAAELRELGGSGTIDVLHVDLSDLSTVRAFAEAFKQKYDRLDVLINNAGVMAVPYGTTSDGFERHLGINYLGHFALTGLLLDRIKATPGSRVVNLASMAEKMGSVRAALKKGFDGSGGQGYERWTYYSHSKLAQLMFANALNRRFTEHGYDAKAMGAHPGIAESGLRDARHTEPNLIHRAAHWFFEVMAQSQEAGILPLLYAATDPGAEGGTYYGVRTLQMWGPPAENRPQRQANDDQLAAELWQASEEATGVTYSF